MPFNTCWWWAPFYLWCFWATNRLADGRIRSQLPNVANASNFLSLYTYWISVFCYIYICTSEKKKSKREENHVETNWHDKFHCLKGIFSVLFATQNNITDNNKKIRSILLKHWCGAKNCLLYFHTQFRSKSICSDNILEHINWHDSSFIGKHWHQSSYSATMFIFIGSIKG